MDKNSVSIVRAVLYPGRVSIGLRLGLSDRVRILEGWDALDPHEASRIAEDIAAGRISSAELASKPYREVYLPVGQEKERE